MSRTARIVKPEDVPREAQPDSAKVADPAVEAPETFEWKLADGSSIVVGKPKGVLKLKLRDLLPADLLKDPEIVGIASAMLCIRTINGHPPILRTYSEFGFLLDRFGTDADVEAFMGEYQKLINPGLAQVVQEAIDEAIRDRLSADDTRALISLKMLEYEAANRERVKR
jgi:hypothetical protein